jgi:hypothetical protein
MVVRLALGEEVDPAYGFGMGGGGWPARLAGDGVDSTGNCQQQRPGGRLEGLAGRYHSTAMVAHSCRIRPDSGVRRPDPAAKGVGRRVLVATRLNAQDLR